MPASIPNQNPHLLSQNRAKKLCLISSLVIFSLALGGCGKKGPLYLPDPDEQQQTKSITQSPSTTSEQETQ